MFTDTHCHIFSSDYSNINEIIENLEKNKVKRIIINGYNQKSNEEVLTIVNKYKNVYGSLGIHPNHIEENYNNNLNFIKNNLNNPKIIAIGEIGLDYFRDKTKKELQIEVFNKFLKMAEDYNKPVIIHTREATEDMVNTLKKYKCKGILHSFSGSYETAKQYISMGYKLGINGILTFKSAKLREVIKKINIKNILLETDSPYLTPEPYRKFKNEPKNIYLIALNIAEIKNISVKTLASLLEENFNEVFDI